jgi:hypothetical protein
MARATTPETPATETPAKAPLPALNLSGAKLAVVSPEVLKVRQRSRGRTAAPRSKEQLIIDQLVKQAHDKWVAAGRPKAFAKSPGGQVTVPAEQQIVVERAIRKAGTYHDLSIRFGDSDPDDNGNVTIVFRVSDRPVKDAAAATAES